jgi:hypothetical protein
LGFGAIGARVREFFFAEEVPYGLAAVRITLPLVLLVDMSRRWAFARESYSSDGASAPIWVNFGFANPFPEMPGSVCVALFTLLLAALVTSSLGWMTRASLAIATALYFYFTALDSIGTISKYTVIASHVLLLLTVSNCGAVWSFDALRRPVAGPRFAVWPRRLMQILLGVIYLGAAMTKIHTPAYFNGDQMMFWMLTHVNGRHPMGEWFANFPGLLVVGAYAAIVWETLFLFLAWRGMARTVMLSLGVGFHFLTYLTLGLDIFPCVMFSAYFCFMGERDAYRWAERFGRLADAAGVPLRATVASVAGMLAPARRLGPVAFVVGMWGVAVAGAAVERASDFYQERGPGGPLALRELDPSLATAMLKGIEPLRAEDQVFAFEIGGGLFGDALVGRRKTFQAGDVLVAQCILAPPHGDAWIECNLHSADGRIISRNGQVLLREVNRRSFSYPICDAVPPGDYELALKVNGTEITRRKFAVLAPGTKAASAAPAAMPAAVMAK